MTQTIQNYVLGAWTPGNGQGTTLFNSVTGDAIGACSTQGLDFKSILQYGRAKGGPALRKLTFQERGRMLKALAMYLIERKEKYYEISYMTGATRVDSWIDIEGGIGNLFAYASLRRQFPNTSFYVDGETAKLSKNNTFNGHHIMVPLEGVAIHINAYNFPIWGMLEKIAVNFLAGVPALVKPATVTCFLTEAMVRDIIASQILPEGALQLICGSAGDMLNYLENQDVVTFTGSAETGRKLKSGAKMIEESVRFNMEADSLNSSILGLDAAPGTADYEIFIKEVVKEITVKCGQKCTAIRRILVPAKYMDDVKQALAARLAKTVVGNPKAEGVRMGALAGKEQLTDVKNKVKTLLKTSELVYGNLDSVNTVDADSERGAFMSSVLLYNNNPLVNTDTHQIEAFGPVSTLMPYNDIEEAVHITKMGKGSLCCSIVTSDTAVAREFVHNAASMHGRILVLNAECAKESTGHGSPMPLLTHGGPGRAGGGEEMGGKRGVMHYLQRTAIQGSPTMLTALTDVYQYGAKQIENDIHPFRRHFEELEIGETVVTHKHTVTDADIVNFANVSGDNFYAHMDATSLDGTIFERRVAHGYFVLSKAAGLFVDPKKGPVLLNYGIDEARFTKPVYPGMTLGVRLTVKEKIEQEKKDENDIAKGIVKWLVDVYDETDETVAIATILTMVKKKNQA